MLEQSYINRVDALRRWALICLRGFVVFQLARCLFYSLTYETLEALAVGSAIAIVMVVFPLVIWLFVGAMTRRFALWLVPRAFVSTPAPPFVRLILRTIIRGTALYVLCVGPLGTVFQEQAHWSQQAFWVAVIAPMSILPLALILWRFERRIATWIVPDLPPTDQCPKCGYSRHGLDSPVCPECGTDLRPRQSA